MAFVWVSLSLFFFVSFLPCFAGSGSCILMMMMMMIVFCVCVAFRVILWYVIWYDNTRLTDMKWWMEAIHGVECCFLHKFLVWYDSTSYLLHDWRKWNDGWSLFTVESHSLYHGGGGGATRVLLPWPSDRWPGIASETGHQKRWWRRLCVFVEPSTANWLAVSDLCGSWNIWRFVCSFGLIPDNSGKV